MKTNLFIILFLLVGFNLSAQNLKSVKDTNEVCIPYDVAKKMLIELNDYDKLKELTKLDKQEIIELNKKVLFLEKINQSWEQKDSLSGQILIKTEEKVEIYKEENKNLAKENKRLKTKNTLYNIFSGLIIAPLTYIAIFK